MVQGGSEGEFLTVRKAAALLKVSAATVYRLVKEGKVTAVRVSHAIRIEIGHPRRPSAARDSLSSGRRGRHLRAKVRSGRRGKYIPKDLIYPHYSPASTN